MKTVRASSTALIAVLLAIFSGPRIANAKPAPLIEPDRSAGNVSTPVDAGSSSDFLFGASLQVAIAAVLVLAIVVAAALLAARLRPPVAAVH